MVSRRLPGHQAPRDANIHNLHLNLAVPVRGANITTPDGRRVRRPRQHATTVGFQFLRGRDGDDPDGYLKELLSSTGSSHLISSHLIIIFTSHLHIFTSQYLVFAHLFPLTIQTFKQHHPP